MTKTGADKPPPPIANNRKARHEYFIEDRYEAGLSLLGWEVKSMRAGRAQLKEAYVHLRNGEAFLVGAHISPLTSASTHVPHTMKWNVVPGPSFGTTQSRPPCCSTIVRLIESPSPIPLGFVV